MGMKRTLVSEAADRAALALEAMERALSDPVTPGLIDATEAPIVFAAMHDAHRAAVTAHKATALGRALECGVGLDTRPDYVLALVDGYLSLDAA